MCMSLLDTGRRRNRGERVGWIKKWLVGSACGCKRKEEEERNGRLLVGVNMCLRGKREGGGWRDSLLVWDVIGKRRERDQEQ